MHSEECQTKRLTRSSTAVELRRENPTTLLLRNESLNIMATKSGLEYKPAFCCFSMPPHNSSKYHMRRLLPGQYAYCRLHPGESVS